VCVSLCACVRVCVCACVRACVCVCVYECPERNVWPPHMRAFNGPVGVAFNSSGDDNCGAM